LPERQVALLQAFHFLLGAQARASILIAFDPELVREAVHTHYHAPNFDVDRFLDKMFHLRVPLPSLNEENLEPLVKAALGLVPADRQATTNLGAQLANVLGFQGGLEAASKALCGVLQSTGYCNPRLVRRMVDRALLYAFADVDRPSLSGPGGAEVFFAWLLICERFTGVRRQLQRSEDHTFDTQFNELVRNSGHPTPELVMGPIGKLIVESARRAFVDLIRRPNIKNVPNIWQFWRRIDKSMINAGL